MPFAQHLTTLVPTLVLLAIALRTRRRLNLPILLPVGLVLLSLLQLGPVFFTVTGSARLQALLYEWFPEANDPNGTHGYSAVVDEEPVGPVFIAVFQLVWILPSIGMLTTGLGTFLFARRSLRARTASHCLPV